MDLARHSTLELTMRRYSQTVLGERAEALSVLPDLNTMPQEAKAAGTYDYAAATAKKLSSSARKHTHAAHAARFVSPSCSPFLGGFDATSCDSVRQNIASGSRRKTPELLRL